MLAHRDQDHVPGFLGGDLPEAERIAYEEGHDADIPSNEGVIRPEPQNHHAAPVHKDVDLDLEKAEHSGHGSSASMSGAAVDHDPEKAQPKTTTEGEEEQDPSIVFWDGPDDPANPLNW